VAVLLHLVLLVLLLEGVLQDVGTHGTGAHSRDGAKHATAGLVRRPAGRAAAYQRGAEAALVVSGEEGLDELSGAGPSQVFRVGDVNVGDMITPEDIGLPRTPTSAIRGGDVAYNAAALRRRLQGETGPYRDAVLLNAAAALVVAGRAATLAEGAEEAAEVLDNGLANALLDCWIAYK